ncbi:hypothetical protein QF004_002502 [Chryseobacterium sp. MDT2-18]|nr:hypothetical protein [Chryseobacterium sp. MDT2-18]
MKTVKIYNVIAVIIILLLVIWVKQLRNDLQKTQDLLNQCSERYYKEVNKEKSYQHSRDLFPY